MVATLTAGHAQALSYRVERMLIPFGVASLSTTTVDGAPRVVARDPEGTAFRVGLDAQGLKVTRIPASAAAADPAITDPDRLPDGLVATGSGPIVAAWLTGPTDRYPHGALGDRIEASGLAVRFRDGRELRMTLADDAVFEDRMPRLADLDGDGNPEVLVVKSTLEQGSSLVAIDTAGDGLRIAAETPPLGAANRWLDPVGTGDFDGDGRTEVAVVTTPHSGGTLRLYEMHAGRLLQEYALPGFSNHAFGSKEIGLSAVLDVNGDGIPDLAVPTADRRGLKVMTVAGGRFQTLAVVANAAPIASDIAVADLDGNGRPDLIYALGNRFLVAVLWNE